MLSRSLARDFPAAKLRVCPLNGLLAFQSLLSRGPGHRGAQTMTSRDCDVSWEPPPLPGAGRESRLSAP